MRKLFLLLLAFLSLAVFPSCNLDNSDDIDPGDIIVDWTPVLIEISVKDKAGIDLLNPKNPDNVLDCTATYQGKTYEVSTPLIETETTQANTRALPVNWYGFCLKKVNEEGIFYRLTFGEIDGAADLDEDIVLSWPDGRKTTIHYHCSDHKVTKSGISVDRYFLVDGKKQESSKIDIVL